MSSADETLSEGRTWYGWHAKRDQAGRAWVSSRGAEDPTAFPSEVEQVEEFTRRSLRWLVLTSLVYRVGVTIPSIFIRRSTLGGTAEALLPILLSFLLFDAVLITVTLTHPTWLGTKPLFFIGD